MKAPLYLPHLFIKESIAIPTDEPDKFICLRYSISKQCLEWKYPSDLEWSDFGCLNKNEQDLYCSIGFRTFNKTINPLPYRAGFLSFTNGINSIYDKLGFTSFSKTNCVDINLDSLEPYNDNSVMRIFSGFKKYSMGIGGKKFDFNENTTFKKAGFVGFELSYKIILDNTFKI